MQLLRLRSPVRAYTIHLPQVAILRSRLPGSYSFSPVENDGNDPPCPAFQAGADPSQLDLHGPRYACAIPVHPAMTWSTAFAEVRGRPGLPSKAEVATSN
jgi:hypothetical protein